jgi:DNA-binding transcriptional ArsR family regulator
LEIIADMAGDVGAVGARDAGAGAGAVGGAEAAGIRGAGEADARDAGGSELAVVLQALADPARLRVVEALSRSPQRAGDLAAVAGVAAPTMSKHLRVLLAAGIVTDERDARDARVRVFRLRRESVVAVRAWLDQVQAHWDEQLRAFSAFVERAHVEREGGR